MFATAGVKFKELYPNVNLIIERGSDGLDFERYASKMATQIIAGTGPDIFFANETDMDINKMMRSGILADMYAYFENDKNFNINDYNKTVFSGGQPSGSQYVVPLSYSIPMYMTTEKMISKSGLDIAKLTDYQAFIQEIDKVLQNAELSKVLPVWDLNSAPIYFPTYSGIKRFNYDTGELNLDSPEIKSIYELLKKHREKYTDVGMTSKFSPYDLVGLWKKEENLFADFTSFPYLLACETFTKAVAFDEKPIMYSLRNVNGKITAKSRDAVAVRGSSENKQNAYNFIKILINAEVIASTMVNTADIPVSNVAVEMSEKRYIEQQQQALGSQFDAYMLASDEFVKQYEALLADVDEMDWCFNTDLLLKTEMQPYFRGELSYEDCM